MKVNKFLTFALLALGAVSFAGSAMAAVSVTLNGGAAGVGGTVNVTHDYLAQDADNVGGYQFDITYDPAAVTPTDLSQCTAGAPATHAGSFCSEPGGAGNGTVRIVIADTAAPTDEIQPFNIAPMGTVVFTVNQVGDHTLTFANASAGDISGANVAISGSNATITGTATGPILSFSPASGSGVDAGDAIVGNAAPGATIDVTEAGTQDVVLDSCSIGGTHPTNFSFAYSGQGAPLPATFTGGSGQTGQIAVGCTPTARGNRTATLVCDVQDGGGATVASPSWNLSCGGLAPNVQVPAGPIGMVGTLAGAAPTAPITVTNPQDGFTSTANNVTAVAGAGDAQITVTGGPASIAPGGSFDFQVSCDNTIEGSFSRTVDFTWDTPSGPATGSDSVQVNCTITDTAPVYESDPAVGSMLSMSAPFGTQSAATGLDVRNGNPNASADDLVINSATANNAVFNVTLGQTTFAGAGAFDGTDDISVTCTPQGVGTVNGTLTVDTNDPAEPAGGFTYPLECTGTGDAVTSAPPDGGTLNLGVAPPDETTSEGFISFTNNGISGNGTADVSCSITTNPDGVFAATTPLSFTIAEGASDSVGFQCTPTEPQQFSGSVSCDVSGAETSTATFTLTCSGQPLIIPTLSQWGLLIMMLSLLLAGGFAARRMML